VVLPRFTLQLQIREPSDRYRINTQCVGHGSPSVGLKEANHTQHDSIAATSNILSEKNLPNMANASAPGCSAAFSPPTVVHLAWRKYKAELQQNPLRTKVPARIAVRASACREHCN
jgi:hypothetical protein